MAESPSRGKAAKASLQPVSYMEVAVSGELLQRSLGKTKPALGFEADFKRGEVKTPRGKLLPK